MNYFRHFPTLSFIILLTIFTSACNRTYLGEGEIVSETRSVSDFKGIALNMGATVYIKDSSVHSCVVKAQKNIQEAIITRIDGNTLVITSKGTLISDEPIVIEISMNRPERFELNGSGDLFGVGQLVNDKMDFEVNGSGSLVMDVVATKLTSAVTGSGNLELSGKTNSFDVEINGSGKAKTFNLSTLTSKAKVSGSGEAEINSVETLKATVSGSGNIYYKGQPKVDESISGSGTIKRVN